MEKKIFSAVFDFDEIKSIIELIDSNNQYNSDGDEVEYWKKIINKFKNSEEL